MLYISSGQPRAWGPNNDLMCAKPFSLLLHCCTNLALGYRYRSGLLSLNGLQCSRSIAVMISVCVSLSVHSVSDCVVCLVLGALS